MRILLVTHGYPPYGVAGVERVAHQTAGAMTGLGHEVTVLTARPTPAPSAPTLEFSVDGGPRVLTIAGGGNQHMQFPGRRIDLERIFERVMIRLQPDVLLVSHMLHHSPSYVRIAHSWGVPVVVELHDFYAACELAHLRRSSGELCDGPEGGVACATECFAGQPMSRPRWALRTHAFREALRRADALVCPSAFVASYFARQGLAGERMHVIPNGVALAGATRPQRAVQRRAGGLHLASIGPLVPHKGQHVVLAALRLAQLPHVRYSLFGPPTDEYAAQLRDASGRIAGLDLRIHGPFELQELPGLLADVDLLLIPSIVWETFSIAAREALACGVPVIASRLGALPEAVREGENGLLVGPDDPGELAAVLAALAAHPDRLAQLRRGIKPTDWLPVDARTTRVSALLRRVIDAGVPAPESADEGVELEQMRGLLV